MSLYLLLVLIIVMVVFSKVQANRRRKNMATLEEAIQPGVRVVTTAGIYGIVVEIESDTIVLEVSEGVDVRFAKAAVVRVVPHLDDDDTVDAVDEVDDEFDDEFDAVAEGDAHHEAESARDLDGKAADAPQGDKGHTSGKAVISSSETNPEADSLPVRSRS